MAVIRFFKNNGAGQRRADGPTAYVHGPHAALSDEQRQQYSKLTLAIHEATEADNDLLVRQLTAARDSIRGKLRDPAPQPLSDNREAVEYSITQSPHKYKYSSGVIAHAVEDNQKLAENPAIEREFRELFEKMIFAGLPEEDHLVEWVRHTHEGNVENHFVIPRINLRTGKYFNPHPPGAEKDFNAIRDFLNAKYQLASPLDKERMKSVANVSYHDSNRELKTALGDDVHTLVVKRQLNSRQEVIAWLNEPQTQKIYGFGRVEAKRDYIRIVPKGKSKAVRLKGVLFSSKFTDISSILPSTIIEQKSKQSLDALWRQVEKSIAKRRTFNAERYASVQEKASNPSAPNHELSEQGEVATSSAEPGAQPENSPGTALVIGQEAGALPVSPFEEGLPIWQKQAITVTYRARWNSWAWSPDVKTPQARLIAEVMRLAALILDLLVGKNYDTSRTTITRISHYYAKRQRSVDEQSVGGTEPDRGKSGADPARSPDFEEETDWIWEAGQRQQQLSRDLGAAVAETAATVERITATDCSIRERTSGIVGRVTDHIVNVEKRIAALKWRAKLMQRPDAVRSSESENKTPSNVQGRERDGHSNIEDNEPEI